MLGRKRSKFPAEEDTVSEFYPYSFHLHLAVYACTRIHAHVHRMMGMAVVGNKVNRVAFREMDLLYRRLSPFTQINDLSFNYESSWGN